MTESEVNRRMGARIKQVRKLRGLTQMRVAKFVRSKSPATLSNYEAGERAVSIYQLLRLSEVLRVEPHVWLLGDKEWEIYLETVEPTP